jgi:hypothetical protein
VAKETACAPPVEALFEQWKEVLETPGRRVPSNVESASTELVDLWWPVTKEEVVASELKVKTAPGLDNITVKAWKSISPNFRRIFYNLLMLRGRAPEFLTKGRTNFIYKKAGGSAIPTDYWPITVASVVIRRFQKYSPCAFRRNTNGTSFSAHGVLRRESNYTERAVADGPNALAGSKPGFHRHQQGV